MNMFITVLLFTATSGSVAIADVTIDACAAKNSIRYPLLAADIQSLCEMSSSIRALLGFSTSGVAVHVLGAQVFQNLWEATRTLWKALKCPEIWTTSLYMYITLALTINICEGKFYWYTDPTAGPTFSQEFVGIIFAISTIGSVLGVVVYHKVLKDYSFRSLLFWAQLHSGISGFLDLIMVMRWNVKLGIPDYLFVIIDESSLHMMNRIKCLPMLVLSAKLCPSGIEGTFFALLKAIDKFGLISSSWIGGLLLHFLNVIHTD